MNSKIFKSMMVAIIATMSFTFSSCLQDEPYHTPLLGVWELYYTNNVPVIKRDVNKFRFNANGSGTFAYYDKYGRWVEDPFTWSSWLESSLTITFNSDLKSYSMNYRIKYDGSLDIYNTDLFSGVNSYFPVARSSK